MTDLRMTSVTIYVPKKGSWTEHGLTEAEAKSLVALSRAEGRIANIITVPQPSRKSYR